MSKVSVDFDFKDRYDINDLISLIALLRAPDGCPWDREQTHFSIKKNFIEEVYEVVDAIENENTDNLREELGDVLMQIALHCEMEREVGSFDFNDVCDELCKKLVVRHPHVFGSVSADNADEALLSWDTVKQTLKGQKKISETMDSITNCLPALMRAQKVQSKASKVGFDWNDINGAVEKLEEEINELKIAVEQNSSCDIEEELGDVLFSCVNVSRFAKLDSEEVLRGATDKFVRRFKLVEKFAHEEGVNLSDCSIEQLDLFWNKAKKY